MATCIKCKDILSEDRIFIYVESTKLCLGCAVNLMQTTDDFLAIINLYKLIHGTSSLNCITGCGQQITNTTLSYAIADVTVCHTCAFTMFYNSQMIIQRIRDLKTQESED